MREVHNLDAQIYNLQNKKLQLRSYFPRISTI